MSDKVEDGRLTISVSKRQLIVGGAVVLVIAAIFFIPGSSLTGFLVADQEEDISSSGGSSDLSESEQSLETDSNQDSSTNNSSDSDSGSKLFGESNASVGPHGSTHEHAAFVVAIDGKRIDFSRKLFQLRSKKVHFEQGNGKVIHKHADGVTIDYALNTLGMDLTENCLLLGKKHNFCEDKGDLKVAVDGEEAPRWHEISENETIAVTFNSQK